MKINFQRVADVKTLRWLDRWLACISAERGKLYLRFNLLQVELYLLGSMFCRQTLVQRYVLTNAYRINCYTGEEGNYRQTKEKKNDNRICGTIERTKSVSVNKRSISCCLNTRFLPSKERKRKNADREMPSPLGSKRIDFRENCQLL